MFRRGQRVAVAVSGGADSVCLLHVLVELAPRWELRLSVAHLDHRLRGEESREDARFVGTMAARLGLEFHGAEADVRAEGDNLEQAARQARLRFFYELLRSGAAHRVALGHTRSDQAETVLFRFLRGAGTAGLAGIRPVTAEGLVRPLLDVDRGEVETWLRERGIAWREDSTNSTPAFARNRIRHELLPQLTREWNPALSLTLAHTADWALEEEAYWEAEIEKLAEAHLVFRPPAVLMRVESLRSLAPAVARRLVRRAIEMVKGDLRTIEFNHVRAALVLAGSAEGHGRMQAPGLDIYRSFDWLRLAPPGVENLDNRNYRHLLPVPGRVALPGGWAIHAEVIENLGAEELFECVYNEEMSSLDWDRVPGALEVRNWRPGDQYQPLGHTGKVKIKSLFQDARIPLWERRHWPIVTSGDGILWARQFGPAATLAASAASRLVLRIRETAE
jgi:tRNA(Ile)-lysidine synthase